MQVELRREADGDGFRFTAWADGRLLGRIAGREDQGWLRVVVGDGSTSGSGRAGSGAAGSGVSESALRQGLVGALTALARSERLAGVVLAAPNLLLRHEARGAGFAGPIRGDLLRDLRQPDPAAHPGETRQERFLSELRPLLPGVEIVATDRWAGRVRSFMRTASAGLAGTIHLTARLPSDSKPLQLALPLRDDTMAEPVALGIDTALGVRHRFHPLVDGIRIFYDHAIEGLRTGTVGGVAEAQVRDIHLNPAYALVSELEALDRFQQEPRALLDADQPERRPSLMVTPPFTRIDSVVAHEYWHQIEFGFETSRYRDSVEFRRAVGGYFGVETLEHVIKGKAAGAPLSWHAACVRLAEEVSGYATTAPKEATAELFSQWWCTPAAPPASAVAFGEILRRFFPEADLVR